ncbi:hypothetical protein PENSPDRAFT_693324 [Peniophora sp. CONT]|nr:hypothetical protein PENSPDRAFT_693324 [Peniophora sp. CONT]
MLTPSPLRRKTLRPADSDTSVDGELGLETPIDAEDIFGGSPYRATAPLRSFDAHLRSSARFGGMEEDEEDDDDDDRVFLSTPARHSTPGRPKRTGGSTARLRTPVNNSRPRPHSTVEPTPLPAAFAHARTPARRTPLRVNTQTTGIKRKSTELNFQPSPQAKGALTPLSVTRPGGQSSFDRLAPLPLPAPKFKRRDEPELFLGRSGTMDGLSIGNASFADDEQVIDVSPDGHVAKRRAKTRPLSQDLANGTGGTVAFPSAAEARTRTLSNESSSSNHNSLRPTRQRLSHASNVTSRTRTKSGVQGLSRAQTIAAATPGRPIARRLESNGSATLFFGPPIVKSSTPARRHRSPPPSDSARRSFARHSYAGPSASPVPFGPGRSSSPSLPDDEPMGEISDEDAARSMPDVSMIADMDAEEDMEGMDEEDLFFASSSFRSDRADEGTGADSSADDSFGWGSAPAHASTFSINVTASTPSPRKPAKAMLEKKFKPRDSGIGLTDDEDGPRPGLRAPAVPSFARGFGIGRSGSVNMMAPPPMVPSSSASTTASSDLEALVTPGFGPSASSGWPNFASTSTFTSGSDLLGLLSADADNAVDQFIARTLASAQAPALPGAGEPKRAAPGTPQKRARAQDRAWHSAFTTNKVGFDYAGDEEVEGEEGGKKKKKPRKSLPAAFPSLGMGIGKAKPKLTLPGVRKGLVSGARVGESDLDSDSESPEKRAAGKYAGIGLGRPQRPGAAWLLRRSSSGAISTISSGESSWPNTPTAATAGGKGGWQLPPPRIPPAAGQTPVQVHSRLPSRLSPASTRTASSSSTSTATASPLGSRLLQISQPTNATRLTSPLKASSANNQPKHRTTTLPPTVTVTKTNVRRGGRPSLPAMPLSSDCRPGRFEAEFVEAGEIGSGEFGKVMRVKLKETSYAGEEENEWAVKRSKRFEGARHRLRVREEVDVLQHLARAYVGQGKWHPNVLGIVDAWEEDEALFIRTELCALGSFSRFLWEFGRKFERLDEARVWKVAADLSSSFRHFFSSLLPVCDYSTAEAFEGPLFGILSGVLLIRLVAFNHFRTRHLPRGGAASRIRFCVPLLVGLAFVHASGVLHLDLKPANIFLTAAGRFKLGDFGMATLWPRAGTPAPLPGEGAERPPGFEREGDKCYLAPEVLQGRYGPAADIFRGEQWHRLRQDDLSGVDLAGSSAALVGLLSALLRSDYAARPDASAVCAHPVVARVKSAMELAGPGAGSPLAPVPPGFLAHVLGDEEEDGEEDMEML